MDLIIWLWAILNVEISEAGIVPEWIGIVPSIHHLSACERAFDASLAIDAF
jgi:hypothetical protein